MQGYSIFLIVSSIAIFVPFFEDNKATDHRFEFENWATHYEGKELAKLELTEKEKLFYNNFKGSIAKFTDGKRKYIFKKVFEPTRKLHPAVDCFKAIGYSIHFLQSDDSKWQLFEAEKNGLRLRIKESIADTKNNHWNNISSWYWAAILGNSKGPWTSTTIVEQF